MTKGSLDCNRCPHIFERDPNRRGFLRSSLGGGKTSQGCGPHVCLSPWPRAELWTLILDASEVMFILDTYFGRFHFGRLFWTSEFGRPGAGTSSIRDPDVHLTLIIFLISTIYLCEYISLKFRTVYLNWIGCLVKSLV